MEKLNLLIVKKWHLYLLTLPFSVLFVWLINTHNFLDLSDTGKFSHVFISAFLSTIVGLLLEWFKGSKTESDVNTGKLQSLTCVSASIVGALLSVIFPPALLIAGISVSSIIILELYRIFLNRK
jgi:hypothetical protein